MPGEIRPHHRKGRATYYTIYINGKDVHLGTDLAQAHAKASQLLEGKNPTREAVTISGMCEAWRKSGLPEWKLNHFGEWGGEIPLASLSDLQPFADYLVRAGFKPASVRDYLRHARSCIQWAIDQGWTASVPPMPKKLPKRVRAPRDIDPAVLIAALDKLGRSKNLVRFIAATGCRPSEACNLKWEQVSLRTATAIVGEHKTAHHGKSRTIYLTPAAMAVLAEMQTKEGYVFLSRFKKPYTPMGLRAILKKHGIPGAYCLRHTAAQNWLEQGIDFGVVAGLLGHTDLRTVQVYAQVRDKRLVSAAKGIKGLEAES